MVYRSDKRMIHYVDGKFVPQEEAVIPVDDLAVLRGLGVFDLIRTFRGRPYFFKEHIQRLVHSAFQIGMTLPWTASDIESIALETLEKNKGIDEANLRIIITGGSSTDFMTYQGKPRLIVLVSFVKKYPDTWYRDGVKIITVEQERDLPDAKSISYLSAAMALEQAKKQGAVEALYINRGQYALEGTTSNIFAFINNILVTPDEGILKGITRQAILSLSKDRFEVQERPVLLDELLTADEIFITGTNKGIVPVVRVDETTIGTGKPGKGTRSIIHALDRHTENFIRNA